MVLNDIYLLAKAIEDTLPEIAKGNGGKDVRHDIQMNIVVDGKDLHEINMDLYEQMNHSMYGFEDSDEVDIEVFGITFKLSKREGT
jgi:hypothetical protein